MIPNNDPNDVSKVMEQLYNALGAMAEVSLCLYNHMIKLGAPESLAEKAVLEVIKLTFSHSLDKNPKGE